RWRGVAWIGALPLSAAFASSLTPPPQWPLPTGIGGVAGDALLRVIANLAGGPLHGAGQTLAASIFGTLAILTLAVAWGFGCHRGDRDADTEDEARRVGSISLGWLVHAFLSLKTRIIRAAVLLSMVVRACLTVIFHREAPPDWRRTEPEL